MTCCWTRNQPRTRIALPMAHVVVMSPESWVVRTGYGELYESNTSTSNHVSGMPYVTPEVHQWIVGQEMFTAYAVHIIPVKHGKLLTRVPMKDFHLRKISKAEVVVAISFATKQEAFMFKLSHGESARRYGV